MALIELIFALNFKSLDIKGIKNIIFDLGNVIINIDPKITYHKIFELLNIIKLEDSKLFNLLEHPIWHQHEIAAINDSELKDFIWNNYAQDANNKDIKLNFDTNFKKAWNALLLDIPKHRLETIQRLSNKYRIFVLSNTNATHIEYVNNLLKTEMKMPTLEQMFEKCYYSHDLKLRKPNLDVYNYVLNDRNIKANETLFLDDRIDNILAAQSIGIKAIQVTENTDITTILKDF